MGISHVWQAKPTTAGLQLVWMARPRGTPPKQGAVASHYKMLDRTWENLWKFQFAGDYDCLLQIQLNSAQSCRDWTLSKCPGNYIWNPKNPLRGTLWYFTIATENGHVYCVFPSHMVVVYQRVSISRFGGRAACGSWRSASGLTDGQMLRPLAMWSAPVKRCPWGFRQKPKIDVSFFVIQQRFNSD